jgi:hypothetical protein
LLEPSFSCDHLPSIQALITGLENGAKAREEQGKPKAIYLHTAGTAELALAGKTPGEFEPTVVDDTDTKQVQSRESCLPDKVETNLC